ncbi:MAG: hypothetical protein LBT50_11110 [Prevotellaceae bacterium]|jgi:hypothetical protein|nr:hypothetical protein [Prevotellaceae bacterium]
MKKNTFHIFQQIDKNGKTFSEGYSFYDKENRIAYSYDLKDSANINIAYTKHKISPQERIAQDTKTNISSVNPKFRISKDPILLIMEKN